MTPERSSQRWAWLAHPRAAWLGVALALLVTLPSLRVGLLLDDHLHRVFLLAHLASGVPLSWGLFDVCCHGGPAEVSARIAVGALPWWTLPQLSMSLFRPLAVLTQYLDYALWPNSPALMHAQNLFWYALLVGLVAAFYRRVMNSTGAALLALLLYAADEAHSEGVAWIASRNTLLTAAGVMAALLAYDHARRGGSRIAAWLAGPFLLTAFASGEGAIIAWAYLLPYAALLDRGTLRARTLALAPMAIITIGWQCLYRALGYGTHGSGVYRDPFDAPWVFLSHRVPQVLPEVLREELWVSAAARSQFPVLGHGAWNALGGLFALLAVLLWLRLCRSRRESLFWLLALLASALPICAIGMTPRLLFLPSVAAFGLIADLLTTTLRAAADLGARFASFTRLLPAAAVLFAGVVLFVHGSLALLVAPHAYNVLVGYERMFQRSAAGLPAHAAATDALYVLNTENYFVSSLSPVYAAPGSWPIPSFILGAALGPVRVDRPDIDSIVLTPRDGYLREPFSQIVRAPEYPFVVGQSFVMGAMQVTVEALTTDGRPARVRFAMAQLEDPRHLWVTWTRGIYRRVQLPAVSSSLQLTDF